ncbi:MAG: carboxypeptidase-like regulatory domain-containing protein, partial [Acidobacteriia bacterium]|nr:carboxypeptidase-like regulatory domain-containing protein [Terriglobia bacterium]
MKAEIRYALLVTFLALLAAIPAWSQGTTGLSGTVTDASGGVVPGVTVTIVNEATQATRGAVTGADGTYTFTLLPPGTYRAEFALQGFKTAVRNDVVCQIGTNQVLSVKLEIGEIRDQVVVEGGAVKVNTTDASVGNPFGENQVRQLPLEARNPSQLLSLQAGVVWAGEQLNDERAGSVFGGRGNQGNITLDGADVNDQVNQSAMQSVLPVPIDSVQEFRVTTLSSGAQYGRSSGAQVELVTKSGSNSFHGSAYEFNRNEKLASNGFMENRLGIPKAPLKRNIYGASLGGPFLKNRVFFFMNWEGRKDATATPQTRVVPTDSYRDGVLMYQCEEAGDCPATTVKGLTSNFQVPAGWYGLTPTQVATVIDPCGSTNCVDLLGRKITPGVNSNIISMLRGYPHGNDPSLGSIEGLDNGYNSIGYRFNPPIKVSNDDYVARLDFNLDSKGKHTVYWRGSLANDAQIQVPAQFPTDVLTGETASATANLLNNSKG